MKRLLQLSPLFVFCLGDFLVPELPRDAYIKHGDIDLGGIFRVHEYEAGKLCGNRARNAKAFQYLESMVYSLNVVNGRSDILPNITLGFVILDDCVNQQTAYSRALQYVPVINGCLRSLVNSTPRYDVIGVISGSNSGNTMAAGSALNVFRIPIVGAVATSELLSDKVQYQYFIRVVPPDNYQARAIVDILRHHNWSYVSALNSEGSYGANGIKRVAEYAKKNGICIGYSEEIPKGSSVEDFDSLVESLMRHKSARVVVLFTNNVDGRNIMEAAKRAGALDYFIWIASDSVNPSSDISGVEDVAAAGFYIQLFSQGGAAGFQDYFGNLHPDNSTNPWLSQLWEREFGCTWNVTISSKPPCNNFKSILELPGYKATNTTALFMDTVLTFAYGIDHLVRGNCPAAFTDKSLLRACIPGELLLKYMKNLTFDGASGNIRFDEKGDAAGKYRIIQVQKKASSYDVVTVGYWDKLSESLVDMSTDLYWGNRSGSGRLPESLCSKPCRSEEFYIPQELRCCWECRKCRDNEIVVRNQSACESCPRLTWPDQIEFRRCVNIPPTYIRADSPIAMVCISLSVIGIIICIMVFVVYIKYRGEKLIKATSRELSLISLFGVMMSLVTAACIILPPSAFLCVVSRIGFILGFTLVYSPVLVKTNRIYRIFSSAKKGNQRPGFIKNKLQVAFASVLISIQVIIATVTTIIAPPNAVLRMPVAGEKYVELLCDLPMMGLIPGLAYNMLLIFTCSAYAFKARALPQNFNESKFIFISVCTTLFLWIAFIPTYFTAFYAIQKAMLLSLVLILNSSVVLFCLYLPKVYALLYVDESKLHLGHTNEGVAGVGTMTLSSGSDPPNSKQKI